MHCFLKALKMGHMYKRLRLQCAVKAGKVGVKICEKRAENIENAHIHLAANLTFERDAKTKHAPTHSRGSLPHNLYMLETLAQSDRTNARQSGRQKIRENPNHPLAYVPRNESSVYSLGKR